MITADQANRLIDHYLDIDTHLHYIETKIRKSARSIFKDIQYDTKDIQEEYVPIIMRELRLNGFSVIRYKNYLDISWSK